MNSSHQSPFPLYQTLPLPELSPFEIYRRLVIPGTNSFLLESGKGDSEIGRYSFIGTNPYLTFKCKDSTIEIIEPSGTRVLHGDPLTELRKIFSRVGYPNAKSLPPFFGGAAGYFSYDFVRSLENLPRASADSLQVPDAHLIFVDLIIAIDHLKKQLHVIFAPPKDLTTSKPLSLLYSNWNQKLADIKIRLQTTAPPLKALPTTQPRFTSTHSKNEYIRQVEKCQEYITSGDIYQANLSQQFIADLNNYDSHALYQRLREINPAPFAAFIEFDDITIASVSPERLVRLQNRIAETRPLAGTRQRGKTHIADQQLNKELLTNAKERAEHVMLVDLERNDLGRVCSYGTVQTSEFMSIEQCSHVKHIVSTIQGQLSPSRDAFDLLQAMFPGGTITGAPKIRCMEILDELESTTRGAYTGSVGYLSLAGDLDLNILIRSLIIKDNRGYIRVGAGIVADSIPEREYEETLLKAEALFAAIRT